MCGRYAIISAPEALRRLFGYQETPNFPARYNVAPTQPIPHCAPAGRKAELCAGTLGVAAGLGQGSADVFPADQCALRGGDRQTGLPGRHAAAPLPHPGRRLLCLEGDRQDQVAILHPAQVRRADGVCRIVGDLDRAERRGDGERRHHHDGGEPGALGSIESRMPAILPPEAFDLWLDCDNVDAETAAALLVPAREELLEFYPVSPAVNRVVNDSPDLIVPAPAADANSEPVAPAKRAKKDDGQASLF
jgi:hypothetical protein